MTEKKLPKVFIPFIKEMNPLWYILIAPVSLAFMFAPLYLLFILWPIYPWGNIFSIIGIFTIWLGLIFGISKLINSLQSKKR